MALRDAEKEALEWAQLVPAAIRVLGDLSDSDDVRGGLLTLWQCCRWAHWPRTGQATQRSSLIDKGQAEIRPGVAIVVGDE